MKYPETIPVRDLFDISAAPLILGETDLSVSTELLPRELPDGRIWIGSLRGGRLRCRMDYGDIINRGGYALIQRGTRIDATGRREPTIVVKRPRIPRIDFGPEALLQWLARETLEEAGYHGSVAAVRDIYQYGGEVRFSMEYIEGRSALAYCLSAKDPSQVLCQILQQVCALLSCLEDVLHLDHRDMKADNLWIREHTPVSYTTKDAAGKEMCITAPFQVVILDFGFACVGDLSSRAIVNLGDGVFPPLDPCPKEGRNMVQLLNSFWSLSALQERLSPRMREELGPFLEQLRAAAVAAGISSRDVHWTYALTRQPRFSVPCLTPARLLEVLRNY